MDDRVKRKYLFTQEQRETNWVCMYDRDSEQTVWLILTRFCTHLCGIRISVEFDNGQNSLNDFDKWLFMIKINLDIVFLQETTESFRVTVTGTDKANKQESWVAYNENASW